MKGIYTDNNLLSAALIPHCGGFLYTLDYFGVTNPPRKARRVMA